VIGDVVRVGVQIRELDGGEGGVCLRLMLTVRVVVVVNVNATVMVRGGEERW
jgi:hypothetical protein